MRKYVQFDWFHMLLSEKNVEIFVTHSYTLRFLLHTVLFLARAGLQITFITNTNCLKLTWLLLKKNTYRLNLRVSYTRRFKIKWRQYPIIYKKRRQL